MKKILLLLLLCSTAYASDWNSAQEGMLQVGGPLRAPGESTFQDIKATGNLDVATGTIESGTMNLIGSFRMGASGDPVATHMFYLDNIDYVGLSGSSDYQRGMFVGVRANPNQWRDGATTHVIHGLGVLAFVDDNPSYTDPFTLDTIRGIYVQYGNYDSDSASVTTNNVYGIALYPYSSTGTIGTLYDMYMGVVDDSAITTHYGIYQHDRDPSNLLSYTIIDANSDSRQLRLRAADATNDYANLYVDTEGDLRFEASDTAGNGYFDFYPGANSSSYSILVRCASESTGDWGKWLVNDTYMNFAYGVSTGNTGVVIDDSNQVGINTLPASLFHVYGTSPQMKLQDSNDDGDNASERIEFWDSNSRQGWIGYTSTDSNMYLLSTDGDVYLYADDAGAARFSGTGTTLGDLTEPWTDLCIREDSIGLDFHETGADDYWSWLFDSGYWAIRNGQYGTSPGNVFVMEHSTGDVTFGPDVSPDYSVEIYRNGATDTPNLGIVGNSAQVVAELGDESATSGEDHGFLSLYDDASKTVYFAADNSASFLKSYSPNIDIFTILNATGTQMIDFSEDGTSDAMIDLKDQDGTVRVRLRADDANPSYFGYSLAVGATVISPAGEQFRVYGDQLIDGSLWAEGNVFVDYNEGGSGYLAWGDATANGEHILFDGAGNDLDFTAGGNTLFKLQGDEDRARFNDTTVDFLRSYTWHRPSYDNMTTTFGNFNDVASGDKGGASNQDGLFIVHFGVTSWPSDMMTFRLHGYELEAGNSHWEARVSAYAYGTTSLWNYETAEIYGNAPFKRIRLGQKTSTSQLCLALGEVGDDWDYPWVYLDQISAGYSAYTTWPAGCTIDWVTDADSDYTWTFDDTRPTAKFIAGVQTDFLDANKLGSIQANDPIDVTGSVTASQHVQSASLIVGDGGLGAGGIYIGDDGLDRIETSGSNMYLVQSGYSLVVMNSGNHYVGIKTTPSNAELDVYGDIYASGDISGDSITDRCEFPSTLNALSAISGIRSSTDKGDGWAELDHDTLPHKVLKEKKVHREGYEIINGNTGEIAALIKIKIKENDTSIDPNDIVGLINLGTDRDKKILDDPAFDEKKYKSKKVDQDVIEKGRDLGNMVSLNTKAIQEMLQLISGQSSVINDLQKQVEDLQKRIIVLEEKDKE